MGSVTVNVPLHTSTPTHSITVASVTGVLTHSVTAPYAGEALTSKDLKLGVRPPCLRLVLVEELCECGHVLFVPFVHLRSSRLRDMRQLNGSADIGQDL